MYRGEVRAWILLLVAGCGRFGFSDAPTVDAARMLDAAVDDAPDAATFSVEGVTRYAMDDDPAGGVIASPQLPATCTTCPTATIGVHGGGYLFDGNAVFQLPSTGLVTAAPYSIAVWFRLDQPTSPGSGRSMVNKPFGDTAATNVANLLVMNDNLPSFETTTDGVANDYLSAVGGVNLGAWHHAAVTWDGTTKQLYLDGALARSTPATVADSNLPVQVGADRDYGVNIYPWIGALDDLQFYSRALTGAEMDVSDGG